MTRSSWITALLLALCTAKSAIVAADPPSNKLIERIAFGSCASEAKPQPIWIPIAATKPELLLLLGDNVYGDTEDMNVMRAKYALLAGMPGFKELRTNVRIMATWDDHDLGVNDGGSEFPKKVESQKEFLDFFNVPADSPRRKREGVYDAEIFGPEGKRVQVIMLDTRYFRSPLNQKEFPENGKGPYEDNKDSKATMLGDAQWAWFKEQLEKPAQIRLVVSSVQVVPEDHGWEKWMNISAERTKLYELVRKTKAEGVIFLSGDRHLAELSVMNEEQTPYPFFDLTSSGLNQASKNWRKPEVNQHRVATMTSGDNFGMVLIDWNVADPVISLQIRDVSGDVFLNQKVKLSLLRLKSKD